MVCTRSSILSLHHPIFDMTRFLRLLICTVLCIPTHSFIVSNGPRTSQRNNSVTLKYGDNTEDLKSSRTRRVILRRAISSFVITAASPAWAVTRESLDDLLYRIVRVREATVMESRLIKTGKFKDIQRANIKLAVRFMVENYKLNDSFLAASTYLDGTNRRLEASQIGQSATQNLITILEYFDASDVENLKVGQSTLSGKEELVLKGLDATRKNIDDFLNFFPTSDVSAVVTRVNDENDANVKEFDPSLGPLLNMPKV